MSCLLSLQEPLDINKYSATIREHSFMNCYELNETGDISITTPPHIYGLSEMQTSYICDVYISHSLHDQKHATFLEKYLKSRCQELKVSCKSNITSSEESLVNAAKCIVVLLSSSYIKSVKEVEEFNIFLSKKRQHEIGHMLYVIKMSELSTEPMYFKLVPCDTSLCDDFWWQYDLKHPQLRKKHSTILSAVEKKLGHGLADGELCPLLKAACDIQMVLKYGR